MMSYWTFSDVFEEQGVVKEPFYGGFGLLAVGGIPKPVLAAFTLLHKLGEERLDVSSDVAVATRRSDGTRVVAVWNYAPPGEAGASTTITLKFKGGSAKHASIERADKEHGDVHAAYEKMGSPRYPTPAQTETLRQAARLPPAETRDLKDGVLTLTLPSHGLAVIEVK
jgi:xylan 1,4-beta-xylosidase